MKDEYALFSGILDGAAMERLVKYLVQVTQNKTKHVHLVFQSDGGGVGNGVMLYNLFKTVPFEMTIYNAGSIFSAALIAYLGAQHRKTSAVSTFSIHRTTDTIQAGREAQFRAAADMLAANDSVTEVILRNHVNLSPAQWDKLNHDGNLYFTGKEAVACGIADAIGDFSPPAGTQFSMI